MYDFVKMFKDNNIKYWMEGKNCSPGFVNTQCRFCDDRSNHLGWNLENGYTKCWKCGFHSLYDTLRKFEIKDIHEYMSENKIIKKINQEYEKKNLNDIILPSKSLNDIHKKYLLNRGFDPELLNEKYKIVGTDHLGYYKDSDFRFRIILPIIYEGDIVSFTARDITNRAELRYKTLAKEHEKIHHKHILYNLDNCFLDYVLVVEGIFDCLKFQNNCVATFGISYTQEQINLLAKRFKKVYIMFDPEKDAQKQAEKMAIDLSFQNVEVDIIKYDSNLDAGEMDYSQIYSIKRNIGI